MPSQQFDFLGQKVEVSFNETTSVLSINLIEFKTGTSFTGDYAKSIGINLGKSQLLSGQRATASARAGAGAVPLTAGICAVTTDGVDALTLADGFPGQEMLIYQVAANGAATITPATSTGWTTAVITAVNDFVLVRYINDTLGWIVVGMGGAGATPVLS